jgi:pyruvate/2-oxoglutarate/acetoin dehydrogenase E1 component
VTDQLVKKFPGRVIDFPPDETSLLGAAMGFSQVGLTPIVEIPYAKYLDCGVDMFYEIAIMNWLSAGQQPNGMIIRLQGVRTVFVTQLYASTPLGTANIYSFSTPTPTLLLSDLNYQKLRCSLPDCQNT